MDIEIKTPLKSVAPRVTFYKLVFVYMLAGLVGTVYETLLNLARGDGFVMCNGSLFTLFNPIYGFGGIMIIIATASYKKPIVVFGVGAFIGAAVEYLLSFFEEVIMGTRSWDYSDLSMNIHGRTTLPLALLWGVLSVCVIFIAYIPLSKLLSSLPQKIFKMASVFFICFILLDSLCTVTVLFRYNSRLNGELPKTQIGKIIDEHFDNDYMRKLFPKMEKADKSKV